MYYAVFEGMNNERLLRNFLNIVQNVFFCVIYIPIRRFICCNFY